MTSTIKETFIVIAIVIGIVSFIGLVASGMYSVDKHQQLEFEDSEEYKCLTSIAEQVCFENDLKFDEYHYTRISYFYCKGFSRDKGQRVQTFYFMPEELQACEVEE